MFHNCYVLLSVAWSWHPSYGENVTMTNILIVITQVAQTRAKEVRNFLKFVQIPKL